MYFEQIPVGAYKNFSYLVADKTSGSAAIFDPAWEPESLWNGISRNGFKLEYIINTHAHLDHIEGNPRMKERSGAKVVMHEVSLANKDVGVKDGDVINLGKYVKLKFMHTPGHSPESMCAIVNDFALVTGDTLFIGECGRVVLPGGDPNALYDSFEKIRKLDPKLIVYPGHDYGSVSHATLADQIRTMLSRK